MYTYTLSIIYDTFALNGSGLGLGSLSSPPLAGHLFTLDPMSVLYLVVGMVLVQVLTVTITWFITSTNNRRSPIKYPDQKPDQKEANWPLRDAPLTP